MVHQRLPDFVVCVQIKANSFGKKLEQEVLSKAQSFQIDEQSNSEGVISYLWEFSTWEGAVSAVESLEEFSQNPNLQLLHARATYDESITPVVFKDVRRPHRVNR